LVVLGCAAYGFFAMSGSTQLRSKYGCVGE
jgi:hypothetical protein